MKLFFSWAFKFHFGCYLLYKSDPFQGLVLCLPMKNSLVVLDFGFVLDLTTSIEQCQKKEPSHSVPCIGVGATIWENELQLCEKVQELDEHRVSCNHLHSFVICADTFAWMCMCMGTL